MSHVQVPLTWGTAAVAAVFAASVASGVPASPQSNRVDQILTEARQALGGDARLSAVRTFRIRGSIRTRSRLGWQSGTFEIACALPDKFVQLENRASASAGETASIAPFDTAFLNTYGGGPSVQHRVTKLGFNGDRVIYERTPDWYTTTTIPPRQTDAELRPWLPKARRGFTHITLALFAASFAGVPLQFSAATGPEAATSIQVTSSDFTGTLSLNPQTHLPERVEHFRYGDYRDVDGQKVPFRITDGVDEWRVKEFVANGAIPPRAFRPSGR